MKKEIKNISFSNGIVENFKQDYFTEQEQLRYALTSCLYLENYNPNLEFNSLVLRNGTNVLEDYNNEKKLATNLQLLSYSQTTNNYDVTKFLIFQNYMRLNYSDRLTLYNKLDAFFLSFRASSDALPDYHKDLINPYVTTLRFHAVNSNTNLEEWQNSFYDKQSFLSLGKFRDAVRYGSNFLYVTEPIDERNEETSQINFNVKKTYFPVYIFGQVKDPKDKFLKSLSENTNNYLNGLTETDLNDEFWKLTQLRKFRTKYPSMIYKNNNQVIVTSIKSEQSIYPNYRHINAAIAKYGWFGGVLIPSEEINGYSTGIGRNLRIYDGKDYNYDPLDIDGNMQQNLPLINSSFVTPDDLEPDLINKPRIDLLIWEQPLLFTGDAVRTTTIQSIKNGDSEIEYQTSTSQTNISTSQRKRMAYSFFHDYLEPTWSRNSQIDYFNFFVDQNVLSITNIRRTGYAPNITYKYPYLESILKPNHSITRALPLSWKETTLVLNNQPYTFYEHSKFLYNGETTYVASRFVAHDYIKVKLPRAWMNNDNIPFLLTATLNGQEIILLKQTYKVSNKLILARYFQNHAISNRKVKINGVVSLWSTTKKDANNVIITTGKAYDFLDYNGNDSVRPSFKYRHAASIGQENGTKEGKTKIGSVNSNIVLKVNTYNTYQIHHGHTFDISGLHNTIQFTIRLNKKALAILLSEGCSNIKVYASRPSDKKLFDKVGSSAIIDSPNIYTKPLIDENSDEKIIDGSQYGLLKTFMIEGKSDIIDDYKDVKKSTYRINSWLMDDDTNQTAFVESNNGSVQINPNKEGNEWIYAIPIKDRQEAGNDINSDLPRTQSLPKFLFAPKNILTDADGNATGIDDKPANNYTPDFFLWDYPSDSESLLTSNSNQYYEGTGAKCITTVKGRTFIGGCYDKEYSEEQGIVRYSAVNAGVNIPDLFVEEEKIQIGHLPITSLLEYREQLWVFNTDNYYRIAINEVFNPATWEFLDSKFGQGTFSTKTLCKTPYGVCFAANGGIYLSDGTNPINLVDNPSQMLVVKSLYQYLMLGETNEYIQINSPGIIKLINDNKHNIFAELFYENTKDELVLTTPIKKEEDKSFNLNDEISEAPLNENEFISSYNSDTHLSNSHWIKLIYSFANKNWRVETGLNYAGLEPRVSSITYAENGRMWENDRFGRVNIALSNIYTPDTTSFYSISVNNFDDNNTKDSIYTDLGLFQRYITGKLTTHEIGDGENDHILMKAILECSPKESSDLLWFNENNSSPIIPSKIDWRVLDYSQSKDPIFLYELRNRTWNNQQIRYNDKDLIELNSIAKGGLNPFYSLAQTPNTGNNFLISPDEQMVARESLNLIAPMDKFRRTRFTLISKVLVKIRSINLMFKKFTRRNY